ncbi:hypothetical protein PILCRDRAFT_817232 [Piloderma croceum F 1598]|uniref:Uncharacterized protein n=1 Tax=Piloderma croceum (strain F 1598) TaxID=765440 RepID=A0A0C3C6G1_PILCF|nr:hypothetical protein PILCRDRAFT_817232 [Piloderma croceum F 1598]
MAWRGSDNLGYYLSQAVLPQMVTGVGTPEMPRQGHGSHRNKLTVRPEPYRKLQSIYQLIEEVFDTLILEWIEDYIPVESLGVEDEDETTGERLSVPANICCNIPPMPLNRPSEISRVSVWIDQLPLETVQRTMHLVYPETKNWKFVHNDVIDIDKDIFDHFQWKDRNDPQNSRLVVVVQPPWILSPQDVQNFQECQLFPTCKGRDPALKSKDRLWGKIWDLCVRQNCPWFVVSTYDRWIFGAFSQGWTAAFVTPIFEWNFQCPTVLAALTYWTASAMGLPGTWDIPEVSVKPVYLTQFLSLFTTSKSE